MEYMTVAEAAKALGLSENGIRDRIYRGEMQADRLGPRLFAIPVSEIERWRAIGRVRPGPKQAKPKSPGSAD
jgi:excisionase family DNA binding protein